MLIISLYSVLCVVFHTAISLTTESRPYHSYLFDGGGHPLTTADHDHMWIRLVASSDPEDVFWLQLANKATTAPMPLLLKKGRASRNTTSMDAVSCLYTAMGALTRPPAVHSSGHSPGNSSIPAQTPQRIMRELRAVSSEQSSSSDAVTSFLTISLCHGIRGIVQLHNSSSYVLIHSEPRSNFTNLQILPSAFIKESPSSTDPLERNLLSYADLAVSRSLLKRRKRSSFHMPVAKMPGPFLVELYIIVDSKMASLNRYDNYRGLLSRITSVMNQINMAFSQFNIYFTVVQLEIWEYDQIKLTDENHILMELQLYKRRFITKRHDCLHAVLGENLGSSRRGQAEPASMCGYSSCVGYTKDYNGQDELKIAHSILHEIGHNFGLQHDTEQCQCYGCIMATGVEFVSSTLEWSNCSRKQMDSLLKSGMADCLKDRPLADLGGLHPVIKEPNNEVVGVDIRFNPMCGNGVVDEGEQCDCGGSKRCQADANQCCNPRTCRLERGASCASGSCCNLATCSLKRAGVVCRPPGQESCDLPEYCDGTSEWCPHDVYKQDGTSCRTAVSREYSLCYRGQCDTRSSRCQRLWGDTGVEASETCFLMNRDGEFVKNCGLEIPHQSERDRQPRNWYAKRCSTTNARCGRLWCSHENERVLRPSTHTSVDVMLGNRHCSAVRFDMDWFFDDPGMVPNGAECGSGKVCWHSACVPASSINAGSSCFCHGHGVCNNLDHCHCDGGFSPPNCTTAGNGGSVDSGPPPPFLVSVRTVIAGVIICLVIILTGLVIAAFIYHYRNHDWPFFLSTIKCLNYKKGQLGCHSPGNGVNTIKYQAPGSRPVSRLVITVDPNSNSDKSSQGLLYPAGSPTSPGVAGLPIIEKQTRPAIVHQKPKPAVINNDTVPKPGKLPPVSLKKPGKLTGPMGGEEARPPIICEKPPKQSGKATGPQVTVKKPGLKPGLPPRNEPEPANQVGSQLARDAVAKVMTGPSSKPSSAVKKTPQKQIGGSTSGALSDSVLSKQSSLATSAAARACPDNPVLKTTISRPQLDKFSNQQPATKVSSGPPGPPSATKVFSGPSGPPSAKKVSSGPSGPPSATKVFSGPSGPPSATKVSSGPSGPPSATKVFSGPSGPPSATKVSSGPSGPPSATKVTASDKRPPILINKPSSVPPAAATVAATQAGPTELPTVAIASGGPRRFQTAQISQPRLDRTTCTDATRALPSTDKTLTRQVDSHEILLVDPRSAVKYL